MAELKKSFIVHLDMLNVLDELDDRQAGKLLKAIREYQLRLVEKDGQDADAEDDWAVNDFVTRIAFAPFKAQFDRDYEKWLETSAKNRENANKRWNKSNANDATSCDRIPRHAKNADNDNVNDNDNDNVNVNGNSKRFSPPFIDDVIAYFLEKGYTEQSARKAFEYYDTANWHDSKGNKVKNWKQKMQSVWFKDEHKEPVKVKKFTYSEADIQPVRQW